MSWKSTYFDDEKINKNNVYKNKKPFIINDIDVNKTLISKKKPYGKKIHLNNSLDIMMMVTIMYKVSSNDWICWAL